MLVTWDTTTNRRRLAAHAASVRTALPAGSREIVAWLRDPAGPPVAGVWFVPNAQGMSAMGVRRHRVRVARLVPRMPGSPDGTSLAPSHPSATGPPPYAHHVCRSRRRPA